MSMKSVKRITPFKPKTLTDTQKLKLQQGVFTTYSFTNHEANERGLAGWTDEHKQAWELARMDEMTEI